MSDEQKENMGSRPGRVPWNKGITTGKKGMNYEEIYGAEKAARMKEQRRLQKLEYWAKRNSQ